MTHIKSFLRRLLSRRLPYTWEEVERVYEREYRWTHGKLPVFDGNRVKREFVGLHVMATDPRGDMKPIAFVYRHPCWEVVMFLSMYASVSMQAMNFIANVMLRFDELMVSKEEV